MRYKIRNVSKRKDISRVDSSVVGRVVEFDLNDIRRQMGSDEPVLIKCVTDCAGVPYSPNQTVMMRLESIMSINWFYGKKVIVIEDRDTIYTFDREK